MSDVTSDYIQIVLRSLVFTVSQAFLAAGVSAGLGVFFALLASLNPTQKYSAHGMLTTVGRFLFSIPGVVTAFLFLQTIDFLKLKSLQEGFGAIVLCHIIFSVGWVLSESSRGMQRKMAGGFCEQLETAASMGFSFGAQFFTGPLRNLWQKEFLYYFSFLFFIYVNSFSTVLILGGGPKYSTLDVLNFFNFQQNQYFFY